MANALQLSSELGVPDRLNKQNIHAYRLKVKQLRYVLQMSDAANRQRFVDKLGEVKDAIGEWHDWDELISIATELLNHGRNCKFLRKLKRVSKEKYESALLLANGMRRTYLPPRQTNVRAASKNEPRRGLARPVLVATSAIAD